jgi:signal transduction histidine kinase
VSPRRFSTLAALVLAAVVLATGVCLVNGALRIGASFPGFLVAENRTVFSIGRPGWSIEKLPRAFFSQVIAVDGRPITRAEEIQAAIAGRPPGTPVRYRFRKGAEIFAAEVAVQRFAAGDFFAVYGTYAGVGLAFALTGFWAAWRARRADRVPPATAAFFVLCQCVGCALGTAGDVYGPYWFVPLYFAAQCATFAGLIHLAISYPQALGVGSRWRRAGLALVYLGALLLAAGLVASGDDVALFVPLLYVVYLLLANAIFLYLGALASGFSGATPQAARAGLGRALAGLLAVVLLPAMIFLIYPILQRSISPFVLVGPLVLFPLLTVTALPRGGDAALGQGARSVRLRLTLLFLGAVETSFLIAVAVFWQSNSWAQLFDDVTLNQRQRAAVEQLLLVPAAVDADGARALAGVAATVDESALAGAARDAFARGDREAARAALVRLDGLYATTGEHLDARRRWIGGLAVPVLATLLGIAVLQAVAFAFAVRRWMIGPLDRIAGATSVIATGDLAHRLEPEQTDEFNRLGEAVNAMAASLQAIQRRVELARVARQRAAGAAREAERRRLARELHDGILQDLSAVRLRLGALDEPAPGVAGEASGAIARVIASIRGVVDDLRPPALSGTSLADAISGHARVLAWAQGVELASDFSGTELVPDWAVRDLYRIAQEAVGNALRHAGASRLVLRIVPSGGDVLLEVADDGVGFDPATAVLGGGVLGMRERAAVLGGDLEIDRGPLGGARVRLLLRLLPATPAAPAGPEAGT